MSGNANGTFNPKKALSRAEGASVIKNLLANSSQSINVDKLLDVVTNTISNMHLYKSVDELMEQYNVDEQELIKLKNTFINNPEIMEMIKNHLLTNQVNATDEEIENVITIICIYNLPSTNLQLLISADEMNAKMIAKAIKVWLLEAEYNKISIPNHVVLYNELENFTPEYCADSFTAKSYKTGEGYYYIKIDRDEVTIIIAGSIEEANENINKKYDAARVGVIYTMSIT